MWPRARELPTRFSGSSAAHGRFLRGAAIAGHSGPSSAPSSNSAASGLLYNRHSTARPSLHVSAPSSAGRLGPVHTHYFGLASRLRAADLGAAVMSEGATGISVRFPSRSSGHGTAPSSPVRNHRPIRKIQKNPKKNANPALTWRQPSRQVDAFIAPQPMPQQLQKKGGGDECDLPMDMECGCKTRRLKEQQERQALEQAAAKLVTSVVVSAAPVATAAAADSLAVVPTTFPATTSVVVTRSTSPAAATGVPFQSSFHRRHLPQDCIAFSSAEGRKLFTEAINSRGAGDDYMQIYFPLAEQFITQAEPAFCGLATLAMCLNALQIDPGRLWKGPWRWFSEELFDCCTSLAVAKEKGISMSEFICLARCNGVQTEDYRATADFSLAQFRALVKRSCATSSEIVVLNYSRKVLGQTGDGHFSPIGGYHAERDMVLLMDVARFKYPPHWVRLSLVYEAMQRVDQSIGKPRGLVVLREGAHATGPTLVKQQLVHADEKTTAEIKPAPTPCCNSAAAVEAARRVSAALARPTEG